MPPNTLLPQNHLLAEEEEERENALQQVTCTANILQQKGRAAAVPPPPKEAMDLKHYHCYNNDNGNRHCIVNHTANEAQQTVWSTKDWIYNSATKSPTDINGTWKKTRKKDAVQEEEGGFLIQNEVQGKFGEIHIGGGEMQKMIKMASALPDRSSKSTAMNTNDNEMNKSKKKLKTTEEVTEEEGKRKEVISRSEAFLLDTSCSLLPSSKKSFASTTNTLSFIDSSSACAKYCYLEPPISKLSWSDIDDDVSNNRDNKNDSSANDNQSNSFDDVEYFRGQIKYANESDNIKYRETFSVNPTKCSSVFIAPQPRHSIAKAETIEPRCNLRLPPPTYHLIDNRGDSNVKEHVIEKSNQDVVSRELQQWQDYTSDDIDDIKCNCYSPHNYYRINQDQNITWSVDKKRENEKRDFVTLLPPPPFTQNDCRAKYIPVKLNVPGFPEIDKTLDNSLENSLNNPLSAIADSSIGLFSSPNHSRKCISKSTPNVSLSQNYNNTTFISESEEPTIQQEQHREEEISQVRSRHLKSRPISLIEERVEDFHNIHEIGSCETLSSSVPHIYAPLPLDTILTHPKNTSIQNPIWQFLVCWFASFAQGPTEAQHSFLIQNNPLL